MNALLPTTDQGRLPPIATPANRLLLETRGACFGYRSTPEEWVVRDVDLRLGRGDFLVLVGRNGCGKTTLLRGLLGLTPRKNGSIHWYVPQSSAGYVPQEAAMGHDTPATALDVVRSGSPATWRINSAQALELLCEVGLEKQASLRFGRLSGGQKRRVLIARALMGEPALLLLDEPTVNVDQETEQAMEILFEQLRGRGMAVLATTHAHHWARNADRLLVENGQVHG